MVNGAVAGGGRAALPAPLEHAGAAGLDVGLSLKSSTLRVMWFPNFTHLKIRRRWDLPVGAEVVLLVGEISAQGIIG